MLTLAVVTASAQRYSCIRPSERAGTRQQYVLPEAKTFDPQKTYHQPVILVTCSDTDFSMADPANFYNRIFNERGYNEGVGVGCVADYVRDQSEGRLNRPALPGGVKADMASVSCELWKYDKSCGIGTILHEFFHCLGLPDFYPLGNAKAFSVVDEWDLMDGGNYTNYGWCPPNLSTMEKMMLGWGQPVELTTATSVTAMKSVSDGGDTYIIRNPANRDEYYLLENRQQKDWDFGCPGNGLLIYHVDYDYAKWMNNNVNIDDNHYRYSLFHADVKDYMAWDKKNDGEDDSKWVDEGHLHSQYLSTSAYPYTNPETLVVNASLTNDSKPAATLFNANTDGLKLMSKPITNIQMASDGTVSFDFMKDPVSVTPIRYSANGGDAPVAYFDYSGRCLPSVPSCPGIYIVRYADDTTRKVVR